MRQENTNRGFTLVEVLIVVILLGILSSIAIVAFADTAMEAKCTAYATNLTQFSRVLEIVRIRNGGQFPADQYPGQVPVGAEQYINTADWTGETPLGGRWDWEYDVFGITAGISVVNPDATDADMTIVDSIIDNGRLGSGRFRKISTRYIYVLDRKSVV